MTQKLQKNSKANTWGFRLSLLIFLGCLLTYVFLLRSNDFEASSRLVIEELNDHLENINEEWQEAVDEGSFDKDNRWLLESPQSKYIYSVFKKNNLVYWTSNSIGSAKFLFHTQAGEYVENLKEGKFLLVIKRSENVIFQYFIPLEVKRAFKSSYLDKGALGYFSNDKIRFISNYKGDGIRLTNGFLKAEVLGISQSFLVLNGVVFSLMTLALILLSVFYYRLLPRVKKSVVIQVSFLLWLALIYTLFHLLLRGEVGQLSLFNSGLFALGTAISSFGELILFMYLISLGQPIIIRLLKKGCNEIINTKVREVVQWSVFYLFLYFIWDLIYHVNSNSSWIYDVSESLFISSYKSLFFVLVAMVGYWAYGALNIFNKNTGVSKGFLLTGIFVQVVYLLIGQEKMLIMPFLVGMVSVVMFKVKVAKSLAITTYFYSGFLSACIIASSVVAYRVKKLQDEMDRFATDVMSFRDVETEYMLSVAGKGIQNDQLINDAFFGNLVKKDLVEKKIAKVYLKGITDEFETEVLFFDQNGSRTSVASNLCFSDYEVVLNEKPNRTDFEGIYFKKNIKNNFSVDYYTLIPIEKKGKVLGSIVLLTKQVKQGVEHVMRRLKEDKEYERYSASANFDYVILVNGKPLYSKGEKYLSPTAEVEKEFNYSDLYFQSPVIGGTQVLVRTNYHIVKSLITNFSFYLVLLFVPLFLFQLVRGGYTYMFQNKSAISDRIKIAILMTLIVPMGVLSTVIYSNIDSDYQQEIKGKYAEELERLMPFVSEYAEEYNKRIISTEEFQTSLKNLADQSAIKFNYFNTDGELVFSDNKELYNAGLLAKLIEPNAFKKIQKEPLVYHALENHIGDFKFTSIYGVVNGGDSMLGIVGVPYFNSDSTLNEKRIQVFSTFLIVFILLFLVFYILSEKLILSVNKPLVLLSQRLKTLGLTGKNEPLSYQAEDEIGLLVGEYNKMIVKLEESREALAQSEKESAWREMAKQVAHEIKNPLTPMKLMLQHLQRRLGLVENEDVSKMSDSMGTLITHVDTLSDIATSFSAFAKMPFPVNERFELTQLIKNEISLFAEEESIELTFNYEEQNLYVKFDAKLMGRIVTNLVLNAKQSGEGDQVVKINLQLQKKDDKVLFTISDDGCGIPQDLYSKIFSPNFTTKGTGSGIGLAVAKRGLEQGGGEIWFESEEVEGTQFFIQLPLIQ